MTAQFKHLLITRFNLLFDDPLFQKTKKEREKWLVNRIAKFRPCYESVKNQNNKNFEWLLYLDDSTPVTIRNILKEMLKTHKNFRTIYINKKGAKKNSFFCYDFNRDFIQRIGKLPPFLITTRLDSDDVVFPDFIDRIQKEFKQQDNVAINLSRGIIYNIKKNKKRQIIELSNPFISFIEETNKNIKTVYHWQHPDVRFKVPTKQIIYKPHWIQIVHGGNVGNHIKKIHKYMHFFLNIITSKNTKKTVKTILNKDNKK